MNESITPGMTSEFKFKIQKDKTVPALYPEAEEFVVMPKVFATGFMVGLIEWACIKAVNPYLDWPREQTVGIHIDVNHTAATPPGLEVTVKTRLVEVDGKRLVFEVEAFDDVDRISTGRHERFIINKDKFDARLREKMEKVSGR